MKKIFLVLVLSLFINTLFAQPDLSGTWNTGIDNTLVKIYHKEGVYFGEIISSDNSKAEIGRQIIKDLKYENGEWEGKLYSAKKKKWYDAEMEIEDDNLEISISVGFFSKTIEWKKVKAAKK